MLARSLTFLVLITVSFLYAQPFLGSWFEAGGVYHTCLVNPATECPQSDFGPLGTERVAHHSAVSELRFWQQDVFSYEDSSKSIQDVQGGLDFQLRFASMRGSSLGLGANVTYPKRRIETDSLVYQSAQNPGQATLLLGSDLIQFIANDEESDHRLLMEFELPIYYDPGLWAMHMEWLWKKGLRLRGSLWSVAPREDMVNAMIPDTRARFRWHEQIGQVLVAARPWEGVEFGARGAWSKVESRARSSQLGAEGDIAQAGLSLRFSHGSWRLMQSLEYQKESVNLQWNDSIPKGLAWDVGPGQFNKIWVYQSRLEMQMNPVRLSLWSERRFWNSRNNQGHGESNSVGAGLRYENTVFSVEPGVSLINGLLDVQNNPWADWGSRIQLGSIGEYQALAPTLNVVLLGGGNKITYTWRKAFPWKGSLGNTSALGSWGAEHSLSVTGNL